MKEIIKINEKDNVVVALRDLSKSEIIEVENKKIEIKEDIKRGHKVAISDFKVNDNVIKYGYPIGHAVKDISIGEWIHTHNIKTNLDGIMEYNFNQQLKQVSIENKNLTFDGYRRANGNVGIRNELWIVPTVGCVNGIGERIIEKFKEDVKPVGIDGVEIFQT